MIGYFDGDKLLGIGAVYKASDGTIQKKEMTEEELLSLGKGDVAEKKAECKRLILERYSETDQQNIQTEAIATGDNTDLVKMKDFIFSMISEYRNNGKDADYTNINP